MRKTYTQMGGEGMGVLIPPLCFSVAPKAPTVNTSCHKTLLEKRWPNGP